jgi:transcriptional regulator
MNILQGTLDVLVLQALTAGPSHGYGVAQWIRATTDGTLEIEDGALYTALHRLEKRGLLKASWGTSDNNRRAKYYDLTETGTQELADATRDWTRYADAVSKVLRAGLGTA